LRAAAYRPAWRAQALVAWLAFLAQPLGAQPLPPEAAAADPEIERHQAQELEQERARATQHPDVLSAPREPGPGKLVFPVETPCFRLNQARWDGPAPPASLRRLAATAVGHCIGNQGLKALQAHLQGRLIEQGFMTSRVLIPEQSLASGTLKLRYVPGRISAVKSEAAVGWWRMALPRGPGAALNQRDLDQALENVRRLASQADATFEIVPGPELGDSDRFIKAGSGKRWHAYLAADNTGLEATGEHQLHAGLILDSPLFLYDQLSLSWGSNAALRRQDAFSRTALLYYSLPLGYWTLFAGASQSRYRQSVAGLQAPLLYGGTTQQAELGVSLVPYRGSTYKSSASFKLLRKRVNSTLNDIDIAVQRRDIIGYELNYGHRHYLGQAVLDLGAGVRASLPQLSNAPGYVYAEPHWDGRSTLLLANAGLYLPFKGAGQSLAYQANGQLQHAKTAMVPADYFTLGSRYAVRGFDGQMTLAAENGWSWRNELSLKLGARAQQLYAGLDAGRVSGPSAQSLSGRMLVGAVAGWRGRIGLPYMKASYDFSAGWPLKKPHVLKTRQPVWVASLMVEF